LQVASLVTPRQGAARRIALVGWLSVGALIAMDVAGRLVHAWWWAQGGVFALCAVAIYLVGRPMHGVADPSSVQLRRLGGVALGAWALLTLSLAVAERVPGLDRAALDDAAIVWYVLLALLLVLVPLLSRSQAFAREFALLAAISAVATSLDLLFASYFSFGRFASLTLALFLSLAVYSGARHWILSRFLDTRRLTTERMFEQLYRIAREAEINPHRVPPLLLRLLTDLFEPLQAEPVEGTLMSTRVMDTGSTLLVPVPLAGGGQRSPSGTIRLRFAQRGRREFTLEDARLTDRIVEQLRRVVAFDRAVEQGRTEERLRLAQDLHDDIGARLLTLMYKAQSPEMEEYVRHTLKDLKTLTRGLAASSHPLSHAAAEWKSDLTQRLTAADIELGWTSVADRELLLTVVQWSALTRILRELVSNAIAHARARRVEVAVQLAGDRLSLSVSDNGHGRKPDQWSHGLGLGGVRKRVKQLGGEVEWRDAEPSGVVCRVRIRLQRAHE
jgi:signal transduction histidine kinase